MGQTTEWKRVTKSKPCPICQHPDWCQVGQKVIHCMRVKSDRPVESGGWKHKIDGAIQIMPMRVEKKPRLSDLELHNHFAPLARHWWKGMSEYTKKLAEELGVAAYSLDELRVGYSSEHGYTIPERNHGGQIIGIATRRPDGKKLFVKGGRRGLVYSDGWQDAPGPVLIVEGMSDVATCITMGLCVIGRPNNSGGAALLEKLLRAATRWIIIMGEWDRKQHEELTEAIRQRHDPRCVCCPACFPGSYGAQRVRDSLKCKLPGRSINVRFPPGRAKDLRRWFQVTGVDPENQTACHRVGKSLLRLL